MALTNEDLLAISQLLDVNLDARLKPMEMISKLSRMNKPESISDHSEKLKKIS